MLSLAIQHKLEALISCTLHYRLPYCLFREKLLRVWRDKINARPDLRATYGLLLEKCLEGGDTKTAEAICKLIQEGKYLS
jgi:hypothetical protein